MPFFSLLSQFLSDDIGRSQKRILCKVCVACRHLGILVSEYLLHLVQRTSRVYEKAGEAVTQVMQAYILYSRTFAYSVPRFIDRAYV